MKNEHPCGARHKYKRRALRTPRDTTANRAARREGENPISPPCGARREQQRRTLRTPAAQPQTARHGGSIAGSRGAHADGETRHRASSRRWHRAISPGRGVGSRGATVGRPSAHCASPGRHSGPRSSPPDRAPSRAHLPQPRAQAVRGRADRRAQRASPDARSEQPAWRKANPP